MCAHTEAVLRAYLTRTLGVQEDGWSIRPSGVSGRGLFATRPLATGELIFHDRPVVWESVCAGPRAKPDQPMCAACHRLGRVTQCAGGCCLPICSAECYHDSPRAKPDQPMCAACHRLGRVTQCAGGCCLPICSAECAVSPEHTQECRLVRESVSLPEGGWRLDLLGTVTPLRCLSLSTEDREVVQCLQGNQGKIHGIEVDLLKQRMREKLSKEDEDWMRLCCLAMDTNAFETLKVFKDGSQTSLRGLYPLAAVMNHECSPNSFHVYTGDGIMQVFASRPIAAGEEITTTYSCILWSTPIRRLNLARTKHFFCRCARCSDPTEFGSMLSCLPCTDPGCQGLLLPYHPLSAQSSWFCSCCQAEVSPKQAAQLQAAQGMMLQTLSVAEPSALAQWLARQHLPVQGQVVVQLKTRLIWLLGHDPGFTWPELSQEMLHLKEKCCRDVLVVLDTLRCNYCRMKGLILLELHGSLCEKHRRKRPSGLTDDVLVTEARALLATARVILQNDAAAQTELNLRIQEQVQLESVVT